MDGKVAAVEQDASFILGSALAHLSGDNQQQPTHSQQQQQQQQQQLCLSTARSLHLVSRNELATARAALRCLRLERCYTGQCSLYGRGTPTTIPWDLVAAAPGVTGWSVHADQLPGLVQGLVERPAVAAAAAAGRLRELKVLCIPLVGSERHVQCLLQLLSACTALVQLDLQAYTISMGGLMKGADSRGRQQKDGGLGSQVPNTVATAAAAAAATTAAATAAAAATTAAAAAVGGGTAAGDAAAGAGDGVGSPGGLALQASSQPRLRVLRLDDAYHEQLLHWVQQQLGPRLEVLAVSSRTGKMPLAGSLAQCSRLRSLDIDYPNRFGGLLGAAPPLPEGLSALTSITHLRLHNCGLQQVPEAVRALTGLQSLDLSCNDLNGLGEVSELKQLTALDLTSNKELQDLPAGLGTQLPALQVLRVDGGLLQQQLPALPALTRLEAEEHRGSNGTLCDEGLGSLPSLRHLRLQFGQLGIRHPSCFTVHTGLQLLVLKGGPVWALLPAFGQLAALEHLRHLDLQGVRAAPVWQSATGAQRPQERLALCGTFKHLTHLNLSGCDAWLPMDQLPLLGALPNLQQLHLPDIRIGSLDKLGPWLAQQGALTHLGLDLSRTPVLAEEELKPLPAQLEVLVLQGIPRSGLPPSLSQLCKLKRLHLGGRELRQVPDWLSALRRLEVLDVRHTGVNTRQEVLAALPSLRQVWLREEESVAAYVFEGAKHLHFAQQVPQVGW